MSEQKNTLPDGSKIFCPACNAKLDFSGQIIGSKLPCPGCQARLEVPGVEMTLQEGTKKDTAASDDKKSSDTDKKDETAVKTPESKDSTATSSDDAKKNSDDKQEDSKKDATKSDSEEKHEPKASETKNDSDNKADEDKKDDADTVIQGKPADSDKHSKDDSDTAKVVQPKRAVSKHNSQKPTEEKLKIKCPHCDASNDVTDKPAFQKTACSSCTEPIMVPKRFQHFLLEELVSKEIVSTVYRALDLTLNREVLVKIFSASISSDKALISKLVDAISRSASITHSNIVPVYTSSTHEDQYFIVSQFMNQQSLRNFLEKAGGKLPINAVTKTMHETAKALKVYAESDFHHRNLTPENILVNSDGQIKVSDFEIRSSILNAEGDKWEAKISSLYKPDYASPSLARKGTDQDEKNDIFALGAITYQLITGELPFKSRNFKDLVDEHMDSSPKNPKELESKTPQALSDLVMKMISLRPSDRPDINKVEAAFQKLRGNKGDTPSAAKKATPKNKFTSNENDAPKKLNVAKPGTRSQAPQEGGSNGLISALTFVAILLIGALVYVATDKKDEELKFIPDKKVEEKTPEKVAKVVDSPEENTEQPEEVVTETATTPEPTTDAYSVPEGFQALPPSTSGRPQPTDLIFEPRMASFKDYLAAQPNEQTRLIELERLRFLNRIRPYIEQSLEFGKYHGDILSREFDMAIPGFIFCKFGKFKMGRNGSSISIEVQLENLKDEQFPRILEYLGSTKVEQANTVSTAAANEIKEAASMDYFRAALLAEWQGDLDNSERLLKEAITLSAKLADRYKIFFIR